MSHAPTLTTEPAAPQAFCVPRTPRTRRARWLALGNGDGILAAPLRSQPFRGERPYAAALRRPTRAQERHDGDPAPERGASLPVRTVTHAARASPALLASGATALVTGIALWNALVVGRLSGRCFHARTGRPWPGSVRLASAARALDPRGAPPVCPGVRSPGALGSSGNAPPILPRRSALPGPGARAGRRTRVSRPRRPVAAPDRGLVHALRRRQGGDLRPRALALARGRPGPARARQRRDLPRRFPALPAPRGPRHDRNVQHQRRALLPPRRSQPPLRSRPEPREQRRGPRLSAVLLGGPPARAAGDPADARWGDVLPPVPGLPARAPHTGLRRGGPPGRGGHAQSPRGRRHAARVPVRAGERRQSARRVPRVARRGLQPPARDLRGVALPRDLRRVLRGGGRLCSCGSPP